jgi:hypothetical protein
VLSAGNGRAEIWNARSGKVHQSIFVGPQDAGAFDTSARFSRDGKSIVVTDLDGKLIKTIPVELPPTQVRVRRSARSTSSRSGSASRRRP